VAEHIRTRHVHPSQRNEPRDDGSVRVTLELGDLTEVAAWVLGFGSLAQVVEPASLRAQVRGELERALARYADED